MIVKQWRNYSQRKNLIFEIIKKKKKKTLLSKHKIMSEKEMMFLPFHFVKLEGLAFFMIFSSNISEKIKNYLKKLTKKKISIKSIRSIKILIINKFI